MKDRRLLRSSSHSTLRLLFPVLFLLCCLAFSQWGHAQDNRKPKVNTPPEYPELARRMNVKGSVRVQITVSARGDVVFVKEIGGNPLLLDALKRAVQKWKYEPADKETAIEIKYDFE